MLVIIRPVNDPLHNTGLFGTEIAFFLAFVGIKQYQPDIAISFGYAGCTSISQAVLSPGDIIIAKDRSIYHRREMIIECFKNTTEGLYPILSSPKMVQSLNFKLAIVGTANSFVTNDQIAAEKGIEVVEMELCSVARACFYFNIPCIGIKIISDKIEDENQVLNQQQKEQREKLFLENIQLLREKLYQTFTLVNSYLVGKETSQI